MAKPRYVLPSLWLRYVSLASREHKQKEHTQTARAVGDNNGGPSYDRSCIGNMSSLLGMFSCHGPSFAKGVLFCFLLCYVVDLSRRGPLPDESKSVIPVVPLSSSSSFRPLPSWSSSSSDTKMKILYIITSSSDSFRVKKGMEHFTAGPDDGGGLTESGGRLRQMLMSVALDSIESMIAKGYTVDFFLISSYMVAGVYDDYIRSILPAGVGFDFWEDATPLSYDKDSKNNTVPVRRSLARQHRLVVKDKLFEYDFFACYEDDMVVYGDQIEQYLNLSGKIKQWILEAPPMPQKEPARDMKTSRTYRDVLKKEQLMHVRPGFIRAELLLDQNEYPAQEKPFDVELDYDFSDLDGYGSSNSKNGTNGTDDNDGTTGKDNAVNASVCCGSSRIQALERRPTSDDLMIWETNLEGFGFRQMPDGKWYGLMQGPNYHRPPGRAIDSLRAGELSESLQIQRPKNYDLIAQSAGWMMTRRQLLELQLDVCRAPFLPPFDRPMARDGYHKHNVEFWSGGIQLYTHFDGCNIQRIVQLDPDHFSYHFIYHASNNKQKVIRRERLVKVNVLLGQLNTLRKKAAAAALASSQPKQ